jgi:hypothetical protein
MVDKKTTPDLDSVIEEEIKVVEVDSWNEDPSDIINFDHGNRIDHGIFSKI